jgi:hypothetical protein
VPHSNPYNPGGVRAYGADSFVLLPSLSLSLP